MEIKILKNGEEKKFIFYNRKTQNEKNTKGNVINKIRNHFFENIRIYLNLKLVPYGFKLISIRDLSKNRLKDNEILLQKKIKEFFSEELTGNLKEKKIKTKKL